MNLAIFDVDGTLTETNHVDDICFLQALNDAHSITDVNTDWAGYPHTTDSAIYSDIFRERLNRRPVAADIEKFKNRFVCLLEDNLVKDPALFTEIAGAPLMLRQLNQEPEWRVTIASGGWRISAALKLKVADIDLNNFPGAFADDGLSREEIIQSAVLKAKESYRQGQFERIVSVGDGLWDVRAARNLQIPFLGIGSGDGEKKLRGAGATHVIENFVDYRQLIHCLLDAEVPKQP
jgi:phosphoglycolate phosphatase-like HAD superfamily hydrolase